MAVYDINRILVPEAPPEYEDHTRDVHYVPAPCQVACPIGTDAPSYIAHIWDEDYEGAFEAITATNPFSSICGRVCDAPCEPACRRVDSDGAVQIRNLKRFVMDKLGATYRPPAAPVTRSQSVGIVGAGPAGLVAAHDLCVAGYSVHVYEMTDRLGGMMVWGIPAFRLPPGIIEEDVERLMQRCPGLEVHLDTALGRDVSLGELKERHDAVLLTIGAWWGKPMGIAGEDDERVVDGVGFLRRVNAGERPEMPETVVVGGGDVAMDACRVAKRLPGCKHVKVIYRRGPGEIPARAIELHHAIKEEVEFLYHTQQVSVVPRGNQLALQCVKTALGEPDEDGRRRPVVIEGSEHEILCGAVIAAVGQRGLCEELDRAEMMGPDRVRTEWDSMRTSDPKVFAAGDGAFGGSTIVMAMQHGQRAAYYVRHYLEGNGDPLEGRGFPVDFNFLVRCLAGVATGSVMLEGPFLKTPAETLQSAWEQMQAAFEYLVAVLRQEAFIIGLEDLPTNYVLVPATIYLARQGGQFPTDAIRRRFIRWILLAGLWARYSGASETKGSRQNKLAIDDRNSAFQAG